MKLDDFVFLFAWFLAIGSFVFGIIYIYIGYFHGIRARKIYLKGLGRMAVGQEAYNHGLLACALGVFVFFCGMVAFYIGVLDVKYNPEKLEWLKDTLASLLPGFLG